MRLTFTIAQGEQLDTEALRQAIADATADLVAIQVVGRQIMIDLVDGSTFDPEPIVTEMLAQDWQLLKGVQQVVVWAQTWIDSIAQASGYDSAERCISYLNSSVAIWKTDATNLNAYRDEMWSYLYQQEPSYLNESLELPASYGQFLTMLQAAVDNPVMSTRPTP